jgi:hypothetical protein
MGESDHPVACVEEAIDIRRIAVEGMSALFIISPKITKPSFLYSCFGSFWP